MASDQTVSRDILRAILEQRRTGNGAALESLERVEPDLAEFVMEELGQIHKRLLESGASTKHTRRLYRVVETLVVVAVLALRQGHTRLWQHEEQTADTAGSPKGATADLHTGSAVRVDATHVGEPAPETSTSVVQPAVCPKCGGNQILFLEDVPLKRRVLGVYPDGRYSIHSFYVALDELGQNNRLACDSCNHEWPIDLSACEFL
jgi:hypothetical protein